MCFKYMFKYHFNYAIGPCFGLFETVSILHCKKKGKKRKRVCKVLRYKLGLKINAYHLKENITLILNIQSLCLIIIHSRKLHFKFTVESTVNLQSSSLLRVQL